MAAKHFAAGGGSALCPTICRCLQLPPHAPSLFCVPVPCICPARGSISLGTHEVAESQPQMTARSRASGLRAVGMIPWLGTVGLQQPGGGLQKSACHPGQEGGFACIVWAGSLWNRRKVITHPAACGGEESQAVPRPQAKQKQGVTKQEAKHGRG